ncbi:MAG: hypothetical protein JXA04_04365 [Gammaproteobacteria bacterium]|nr:hypothetical protein [Gammaproteobacteria bacterium]
MFKISNAIILLLMILVSPARSSPEYLESCSDGRLKNAYFLIGVADIVEVSKFYQRMPEKYFKDIKDITGTIGRRKRTIKYYDFNRYQLLMGDYELFHLTDENLPNYRTERDKIIFKKTLHGSAELRAFETKKYNRSTGSLDRHPLFGLIKRKERSILIDILSSISNEPSENIEPSIEVKHDELVFLLTHYGVMHGEIVLSKFHLESFGIPNTHALLKMEIFGGQQDKLTREEEVNLNGVFCAVYRGFVEQFPNIDPAVSYGYKDYFGLASEILPSWKFFKKNIALFKIGNVMVLSIIGFLLLYIIIGRYQKTHHFRCITVKKDEQ